MEDSLKIHLYFFSKSNWPSLSQSLFEASSFTICLLVLTVGEVYNISNKNQLPNRSIKYLLFYTRDLAYRLHFQRKLVLSMANVLGNIHFLQLFHWFWEWVMCLILQINTTFLISQQKTYAFTQETWHISFISKSNRRFPSKAYLGHSQTSKVGLSAKIVNG